MNNIDKIREYKFENVKNGKALNIPDFFEKIIKPQFENVNVITQIHNSLIEYINSARPIFFLRLYGSFPKDKYDLLRRGFVTEYPNKTRMSFCDNTFSLLFAGLKNANISYSSSELTELFLRKELIVGFGQTSKEKELSFYTPQKALRANLNTKGWYQAHIKPTGYGYENLNLKQYFPNPNRNEWNGIEKIRYTENNLSKEQLELLKAHFLRLIHPLNSILVPKRNHVEYGGVNLGEENELLIHTRNFLKNKFKNEYKIFDELSMQYELQESKLKIQNIKWFETPKTIKNKSKVKSKEDETLKEKAINKSTEVELEENVDKWLKAIGKDIFLTVLFPELKKNMEISYQELANKYERYSHFTINSQRSRLSKAKTIFKNGVENEALLNIIDSLKVDEKTRIIASELYNKYGS